MLIASTSCVHGSLLLPAAVPRPHSLIRCNPTRVQMVAYGQFVDRRKAADEVVLAAKSAVKQVEEEQAAARQAVDEKMRATTEAKAALQAAMLAASQAETEQAEAEKAIVDLTAAAQKAADAVTNAEEAVEALILEQREWEAANPVEAAGTLGVQLGAEAAEIAAEGLLTLMFGEKKSVKEAKAAAQAKLAEEAAAIAAKEAEERKAAEEAAAAAAAAAAAEAAEAEAKAAAAAEAEAEAAEAAVAEADAVLRRKREEAQELLKKQRPRKLSESLATAAFDAALGAAAEGSGASWAAERREKLHAEVALQEKMNRLSLFEADLELLDLSLEEDGPVLDEKTLRRAFRERSRVLHPDVRAQQRAEEVDGVPSVYELNAAFEAVRKLL